MKLLIILNKNVLAFVFLFLLVIAECSLYRNAVNYSIWRGFTNLEETIVTETESDAQNEGKEAGIVVEAAINQENFAKEIHSEV